MEPALDPRQALDIAQDARRRLAARAGTPAWYAPGYGLGCGAVVASLALPDGWAVAGMGVAILWIAGLYTLWKRRSGLSVSGYRAGATLPITLAFVLAYAVAMGVSLALRDEPGRGWVPLACGAALALLGGLASAAWDRTWRREMVRGL